MSSSEALPFDLCVLVEDAAKLIRPVGAYLLSQRVSESDIEVKSLNSLVSHVDKTAEAELVSGLSALVTEAGFLAEEGTAGDENQARFRWVIDPLDGTTNLIHGLPVFCVSVALVDGDTPILGVVFDPNRDECFTAWKDGGAYLNGERIRCSSREELSDALIATGFPHWDFERMPEYLEALTAFAKGTRGLRRMGSAAIDLAYVACGRFDAFFEYSLQPWDIAAGLLLVTEAGGLTTDFGGTHNPTGLLSGHEVLAAAPGIAHAATSVTNQCFR